MANIWYIMYVYIKVKVTADTKKESFEILGDDCFKISVKQKAERNMANKRIIELLNIHFGSKIKSIRLVSGHTSPSKIFNIE
jgi:uncharacterized protein YggU (UPF0235/DUF167 family)